jgi:transposase
MKFKELSDKQWDTIHTHIPKPARTGRPRSNDRKTVNGIMFVLVTGCRWREMPERYGSKSTAHRRLQTWQQNETWKNILSGAIKSAHRSGKIDLQKISTDSSGIPAKKGATL